MLSPAKVAAISVLYRGKVVKSCYDKRRSEDTSNAALSTNIRLFPVRRAESRAT